jgi:putative ABC transport system permease protein
VPDSSSVWRTIVGVVGDERQATPAEPARAEIFAPVAQAAVGRMTLVARTPSGDPAALAPALRRAVAELDPQLAVPAVETMEAVAARALALQRFLMTLLLVFAGVGLSLAVVGVYGVLAQVARRRTREMGIRIALGARGRDVRWLVMRHGLRLTVVGLALGAAVALVATRAMRGLLFQVPPADPLTFAVVAAVLAATAGVASWLPALRASRADPSITLRAE